MKASIGLAKEEGPYSSFVGSPLFHGMFQFDLWNINPSTRWDWESLRQEVLKYGAHNSLLLAPMPTASTSQILGYNECFEPYTTNIYTRRVLSGEFIVINKHLMRDLIDLGLWNEQMKQRLIAAGDSIQQFPEISSSLKALYKTVWEIKQKTLLDMVAERSAFICQSHSISLWEMPVFPNSHQCISMDGKKGLKQACTISGLKRRPKRSNLLWKNPFGT